MENNYYFLQFKLFSSKLSDLIDSFGYSLEGRIFDKFEYTFFLLINRIGLNINSISRLANQEGVSHSGYSISLLFRAIISDIIVGYYLYSFKSDKVTFENELKIVDSVFLQYALAVAPEEQKLIEENEELRNNRLNELNKILISEFGELLKDIKANNLVRKKPFAIRNEYGSRRELFTSDEFFQSKKDISETEMFNHLKQKLVNIESYIANLYILWRFFAQYQHFTFFGAQKLFDMDKLKLTLFHLYTLISCYDFIHILSERVFQHEIKEIETLKLKLKHISEELGVFENTN